MECLCVGEVWLRQRRVVKLGVEEFVQSVDLGHVADVKRCLEWISEVKIQLM